MTGIPLALRPSALDHLPPSIRRVAKAACALDASPEDADGMVSIINNTKEASLGQFLPVFFAFLDPCRIPTPEDLDVDILSFRDIHRIHSAQQALGTVHRLTIPAAAQAPVWSRAFAWMQFFLMFAEYLPSVAEFSGRNLCVDFILFSQTLNKVPAGLMVTSRGFFVVVARAWKLLMTFEDPELQRLGLLCVFTFTQEGDNHIHYREELIEGAGYGLGDLAALVVDTISLVAPSRENPLSAQGHDLLYNVLYFVAKFDGLKPSPERAALPPLCGAMVSQTLVQSLATALCAVIRTTAIDSTPSLEMILLILAYIFFSPCGYRKIPEAAKNGIFHAIIEGVRRRGPQERFKAILTQIFIPATVYHTVLSEISEPFREVEGLTSVDSFRRSIIFEEWSTFSDLVSSRLRIMHRFDDRTGVSQRACDNSQCCKIAAKTRFKRCSGCKAVRYCSTHCQAVDWDKGMHQMTCAVTYHAWYKQIDQDMTSRERAFLRFMLHHDYLASKSIILADQISFFRGNPALVSCTVFNYLRGRVEIETFPHSDARQKLGVDEPLWLHHVLRASDSDRRMDVHIMLLPDGGGARFWVVPLRTNNSVMRDSLIRLMDLFPNDETAILIAKYESLRAPSGVVEIH
ncbi:Ankyrin repeat-containing protein [Mycena sanguinolenta]|uniref:phytol kinase n=1 Tax=Mycena sanguinolenta TaxID=230812 RepID=A0A8H6Y4P8_9AGAR|nr:Ankyrin repeat-containing protein [Mycena sanguinolenta]